MTTCLWLKLCGLHFKYITGYEGSTRRQLRSTFKETNLVLVARRATTKTWRRKKVIYIFAIGWNLDNWIRQCKRKTKQFITVINPPAAVMMVLTISGCSRNGRLLACIVWFKCLNLSQLRRCKFDKWLIYWSESSFSFLLLNQGLNKQINKKLINK